MKTLQIATRVDEDIKLEAQKVAKDYGLDLSTAMRMFVTRIAKTHTIPLRLDEPTIVAEPFKSEKEATDFATDLSLGVLKSETW
ncbi:MAG: type II toxin-antitoxin system RelB/DinJ family antitoxin [Lactobacillales bacterium]|jgi:DNA-damage-inducible protein J|nr:type II toxin-antitoxin system RelB/DinJ family antitoxin [Lactobacillales bacterium]